MSVLTDAVVDVGGVDYSSQVNELSLDFSAEEVEDTAMGDSTRSAEGGLKNWGGSFTVYADETTGGANTDLFSQIGTTVTVIFRKSSAAVATDNPNYTGSALLTTESNPVGGAVGDSHQTTFEFTSAGDLSRATS